MSLLTIGDGCLANGEVYGSAGLYIAVYVYGVRLLVLQGVDLILEVSILLLEGGYTVLEGVILIGGERNRNYDRSDGAVTIPIGPAEIEGEAEGSGWKEGDGTPRSILETGLPCLYNIACEVEIKTYVVAEAEIVEKSETVGESVLHLVVSIVIFSHEKTGAGIRNQVPGAGLLIAAESVGDVPKEISVKKVLRETGVAVHIRGEAGGVVIRVVDTSPSKTCSGGRGEPLTYVSIKSETAEEVEIMDFRSFVAGIHTGADAYKPVVAEAICLISTADNLSVFIAVTILLRKSRE